MNGPTTSPFATSTDEPCLSYYAINEQHEAPRSNCARHARSPPATLAGNTPLRLDYCMAARSGFAASATLAPPPKASLRLSPPPRSARLDSRISLGRLTSPDPTPGSNSQMDNSPAAAPPAAQYLAPGNDNRAAAEQLSNVLKRYCPRDWDQAQRADPLCDATRRYTKLGYPNTPQSPFTTTCLHTRGLKLRISSTSPLKAAYYREMMIPRYSSESLSPPPRRLLATTAARSDIFLMTQSAFRCRF